MMLKTSADRSIPPAGKPCQCASKKTLLGKVKTSDLRTASRASQKPKKKTRRAYWRVSPLLSRAAQHFIDALVMVSNAYGKADFNAPKGVWFELKKKSGPIKPAPNATRCIWIQGGSFDRNLLPRHLRLLNRIISGCATPRRRLKTLRLPNSVCACRGSAHNAPDTAEQAITARKWKRCWAYWKLQRLCRNLRRN